MKLMLNNLVYNTDNPVRIARLKELGAEEIEVEETTLSLNDLKNSDLIEMLEERGIEVPKKAKKEDLIALLKEE